MFGSHSCIGGISSPGPGGLGGTLSGGCVGGSEGSGGNGVISGGSGGGAGGSGIGGIPGFTGLGGTLPVPSFFVLVIFPPIIFRFLQYFLYDTVFSLNFS
jgi:hypothetical protein